jgi:hypothetical protein
MIEEQLVPQVEREVRDLLPARLSPRSEEASLGS